MVAFAGLLKVVAGHSRLSSAAMIAGGRDSEGHTQKQKGQRWAQPTFDL
jgi:hypothetical protein